VRRTAGLALSARTCPTKIVAQKKANAPPEGLREVAALNRSTRGHRGLASWASKCNFGAPSSERSTRTVCAPTGAMRWASCPARPDRGRPGAGDPGAGRERVDAPVHHPDDADRRATRARRRSRRCQLAHPAWREAARCHCQVAPRAAPTTTTSIMSICKSSPGCALLKARGVQCVAEAAE
jgi:hypothetical protein